MWEEADDTQEDEDGDGDDVALSLRALALARTCTLHMHNVHTRHTPCQGWMYRLCSMRFAQTAACRTRLPDRAKEGHLRRLPGQTGFLDECSGFREGGKAVTVGFQVHGTASSSRVVDSMVMVMVMVMVIVLVLVLVLMMTMMR